MQSGRHERNYLDIENISMLEIREIYTVFVKVHLILYVRYVLGYILVGQPVMF